MSRADVFHNMTTPELSEKLLDLKQELFNLRFQHSTGQLKNPLQLSTVKKDIARVMTIIKDRELGIPKNAGKVKAQPEKKSKPQASKETSEKNAVQSEDKPEPKVEAKKKKSGGEA